MLVQYIPLSNLLWSPKVWGTVSWACSLIGVEESMWDGVNVSVKLGGSLHYLDLYNSHTVVIVAPI